MVRYEFSQKVLAFTDPSIQPEKKVFGSVIRSFK